MYDLNISVAYEPDFWHFLDINNVTDISAALTE